MAIGVPESEVFQAADAVLARGERPTVERVRLELGRGSPARVGQLLEAWWERLAQRLKGQALLPDLPGETAQAFAEVWRLAVAQAETTARVALSEDQNALFAEQTTLNQERKLWEIALAEAQAQVAECTGKCAQAELQCNERQALVDQIIVQAADLRQQRDQLQAQIERLQSDLHALHAERTTVLDQARAVEDRAHQQVDQARRELKALQQRLERDQRDHAKAIAQFTVEQDTLRRALRTAEQATSRQVGRVEALQATIAQWQRAPTTSPKRGTRHSPLTTTGKPPRRAKKAPL